MQTCVFQSNKENWESISNDIAHLEQSAFGQNAFTPEYLESDFVNPKNTIVVLENEGVLVGFVYAKPVEEAEEDREDEAGETAYIWNIIVDQSHRGQKLGGLLMNTLLTELRNKGYKFIEICAVKEHNFAGNLEKVYKDSIVDMYDLDSKWGPQKFFRIKI